MIKRKSEYCHRLLDRNFNKPLAMAEKKKIKKSATKNLICKRQCNNDVNVKDNCHITGKYRLCT